MTEPTVTQEIARLRAAGYSADFAVTAQGQLQCGSCGHSHPASDAVIESTARFEGQSDPADQAIVFGLRCRSCACLGVLVAAYGPTATAEEAAVVTTLARRSSS